MKFIKSGLILFGSLFLASCATPAEASPYKTCSNGSLVRKNQLCPVPPPPSTNPPPAPTPPPPTPIPDPTPPPVFIPPPSPDVPGLAGETIIADNFNTALGIEPTFYGPPPDNRGGISPTTSINDLGAFRLDCGPGQLAKDDPIAKFGVPGGSHLHQFVGNDLTNANSTYTSLRTIGGTTCGQTSTPLNRSAYWEPAMMVGTNLAKKPKHVFIYYKRFPASSPACSGPAARGICVDLPNGIRYITGYNMTSMSGGPADLRDGQWDYNFMGFDCYGSEDGSVAGVPGFYHTIAAVVAAGCPVGARLHTTVDAPDCWDGTVSATDHRSNVAYAIGADLGYGRQCDSRHPYLIPGMSIQFFYDIDASFVAGQWQLASDIQMATQTGMPVIPGTTLHMDYFEAWSPTVKATWMAQCINRPTSCSGGDLGDGTDIIGGNTPNAGWPIQSPVSATP